MSIDTPFTVEMREGIAYIVTRNSPQWSKPEVNVTGWKAAHLADRVGEVGFSRRISDREFAYYLRDPMRRPVEVLRVRGDAKFDFSIYEPVPCPKVRAGIETRWHEGHWQKLLKKGWENIT